ncbi:hypothetical protein K6L09_20980 [Burkholderia cepacia]
MDLVKVILGFVFALWAAWAIAVLATNPAGVFWGFVDMVSAPIKKFGEFFSR